MSDENLTMDDFSAELEASFKTIEEGDMLTGTVISVDEKEVILLTLDEYETIRIIDKEGYSQ